MSYRVLVVDDTNFMRKMAADYLKKHGYIVAGEAVNGREAVKLYAELQPDIVLMDLTMPEMNGIDAIKEILKINADAVILICSASHQQDMIFHALDAGAKGYLMKPFNPDRLYETIRTYAEPYLNGANAAKTPAVTPDSEARTEILEEPDSADIEAAATAELESAVEAPEELAETHMEAQAEMDLGLEEPQGMQEEAAGHTEPLETDKVQPAATASITQAPPKARSFTSSYICSWQEEIHGQTANYTVTYTSSENKVVIELAGPNREKQTIPFPLEGFRQLSGWVDWLDGQVGGRAGNG